ncbi:MAG: hypothetical protein J5497_05400 [Selenomonadaceae bacterium]|nr:hypothetical protein [Selenomonadaceae bacterium]
MRGLCKTLRSRKIFERMGMKKPQWFSPDDRRSRATMHFSKILYRSQRLAHDNFD